MKNLFHYATKELSQDAFLQWLLDNWSEEGEIGGVSLKFLEFLTGKKWNKEDIDPDSEKTYVWAQKSHMDVGFDIVTKGGEHFLLVIEDKTESKEHHQLTDYDSVIDTWDKSGGDGHQYAQVFKVYYKTAPIRDDEKKRIEAGNEKNKEAKRSKWRIIPPAAIKSFFEQYKEFSESDVLRDYARHVCALIGQASNPPTGDPKKWNYIQWESFFVYLVAREVESLCPEKEKWHWECWNYRGKLLSFAFYYHKYEGQYPLIEFVAREESRSVAAQLHVTTLKEDGKNWTWKKPDGDRGAYWQRILNGLTAKDCLLRQYEETHREKGRQTFAKLKEPVEIGEDHLEESAHRLANLVQDYFRFIQSL